MFKKPSGRLAGQRSFVYGSMTPIMLYMLFFSLLPILWAIALAFFDYSPARTGGPFLGFGGENHFIGLKNFIDLFAQTQPARVFRAAVVNTFIFAFLVLPLNLALTMPLAVMIENVHERLKGFFRAIYFLPTISSAVAAALIWGYIYQPQNGLFSTIIKNLGGTPPKSWLTDPRASVVGIPLAMVAVIISYLWQDFGYNLVIFIAALQGIPQDLKDAAKVDGANGWNEFWLITVPLLKPTMLFVCVMTMLSSFQVFVPFQVMTNGGPDDQTTTLLLTIYRNAFRYQNMGWAAAISLVLSVIILLLTWVQFRLLKTDWEY